MLEMLKKTMLTGIGMALKTRDEVEELAKDWVNKQRMSEEDGRRFMDDLLKKYDSSVDKMEDKIEEIVKKVLQKVNLATRDDLEELRKEIEQLKSASKTGNEHRH
jgi:polyhydroxyalkanoate synthesis regulator phasin